MMRPRKLHYHPWPLYRGGRERERATGLETACGYFRRSVYLTVKLADVTCATCLKVATK